MPRNKDLGQRVSSTIEARWAENARVTQLLKDKLSQSLDNVSMVGNKLKTIKVTIPAKHYYYSVSHILPHKTDETDEYVLFDDKEEIMSCTDDSYVDKFSNYILSKINEELEMNSIYEQMNKIDDKESLNEKYNVRTLKDVKKLAEATKPTKVERPKGFKGSVGGYLAIDRYGTWVSSKPNSGGVKISDANYDWIKETFKLTTLPEEEYKTIWGKGTVYKIEKKDTVNESLSEEHSDEWKAAYSKLNRAAEDAKLHMDPDFVEYALEDDGAYVEDVIENEVTYVGDVLKKEFPNLAYWNFLQDERFSSAIQVYSRPKNSRRFSDVTFEGNYELAHDRLYPIDVE